MPSTKKPSTPMRAIRSKCLDCSGGSSNEVRECVIPECPLFAYRLGRNPNRKGREMTDEEKARCAANLAKARAAASRGESRPAA